MVRVPNLTSVEELPTLSQKMVGGALAAAWSRSDTPPIAADKTGYYAAAYLSGMAGGLSRGRIARCLLWCDCASGHYNPHHFAAYRESALAFPEDERSQFFLAALLYYKVMTDPPLAIRIYTRILTPEWRTIPYWREYELPDRRILMDLATLFCEEGENLEPERVAVIEMALARCVEEPPRSPVRQKLAAHLGAIYRKQHRTDEPAEDVYRFIFQYQSEDNANNAFLAEMLALGNAADANACAVYARQAASLERQGRKSEANHWIVRLAHAYIALGRIDDGSRAVLARAARSEPQDATLAAAHLYASARVHSGTAEPSFVMTLEDALTREEEIAPVFAAQKWSWGTVVRALAVSYGVLGRTDAAARALYARAIDMNPKDRELYGFHARVLALEQNYSPQAVEIYEYCLGITDEETAADKMPLGIAPAPVSKPSFTDDVVTLALAHSYLLHEAFEGPRRPQAILVWEALYRKGKTTPEMVDALVKAYAGEEQIGDIALTLWQRVIEQDPKNGELRLRLAQEWKQRNDFDTAARYYKEAAKLLPKSFLAQYECAVFLKERYSDFTTALRLLQKAVKLPEGKKHLMAHFMLGQILLAKGKRDDAEKSFQYIISEIDANHTETLLVLARLSLKYQEKGMQQAEELYSQAQSQSPEHPEPYRRMADLYQEKGQPDEQQEALEKYLARAEPDAERCQQLADLYIRKGDFIRAERALRQIIAMGEGDKKLYTLLGEVILQGRQSTV